MSKRYKYAPNYHKLYPSVTITPAVMQVLDQSDQKMQYFELDLKTERKRENKQTKAVTMTPAREDSLERLEENHEQQYLLDSVTPEQAIIERDELEQLHLAIHLLEPEERELVKAMFFEDQTERQYAERLGISQKAVNKRWHKVRRKIKKVMG